MADPTLKIKTPVFRASFVNVFKPRKRGDKDPRYTVNVVIPKSETDFWKEVKKKITLAAEAKFNGKVPENLVLPVQDGDKSKYEEWKGCYVFEAWTKLEDPPGASDMSGANISQDKSKLYSGAYFKVTISPFGWFHEDSKRKGVSFSFDNILFVRDGEPFSGRTSAADDFADDIDADGGDEGGPDDEAPDSPLFG